MHPSTSDPPCPPFPGSAAPCPSDPTCSVSQVDSQLYRGQVPKRPGRTNRPRVEDPSKYDNYVVPEGVPPAALPLVAGPGPVPGPVPHGGAPPPPPPPPVPVRQYVPKPFVPRERKQVRSRSGVWQSLDIDEHEAARSI